MLELLIPLTTNNERTEHGKIIPVFYTMSDSRWVLHCFIDRLFRPDKYTESGEDVPAVIDYEIKQLGDMVDVSKREAVIKELSDLRDFVNGLISESDKLAVERYVCEVMKIGGGKR